MNSTRPFHQRFVQLVLLVIGFAFAGSSFADAVDSGVPGMLFEHNVSVTMTDGSPIRLNIYRPDNPGRFPVIMLMGPYGKDTSLADNPAYKVSWQRLLAKYPELCKKSSCRYMRFEAPDPERWVPDGYIVVHADVRGAGSSPGMLEPFSPREIEDYATLITWAAHQPWSTGKVGLLGTSYHAINQWEVAARQPEGLAAILPWEGAFDYYREIGFDGGIVNPAWKFWWDNQVVVNQNGNAASPLVDAATGKKSTGEPLPPELLKTNRESPLDGLLSHPLDGAYYHERTPDASRIVVPLLDVGNWEDWAALQGYITAASKSKWLRLQTGDHMTPFYSEEALALQKRFFDHFLKGRKNGWDSEPPVSIQVRRPDGTFWRKEVSWPLPGTQWDQYYLDAADGGMDPTKEPAATTQQSYQAMGDGVTFKTAPFTGSVEFTGPLMLKLWVSSSTADMDIFATLRLIDPEGRDVTFNGNTDPRAPLNQGFLRVSHRAVDPSKSTEYDPYHPHTVVEPMTPGQFYEADVEFKYPTSIVVPKGYSLALTVQGKDWQYPANAAIVRSKDYDLPNSDNPGLFFAAHPNRDPALYAGTSTIGTGGEHKSYLLLPRIPDNR